MSASEYDSESDPDEDNDDEVLAVIDDILVIKIPQLSLMRLMMQEKQWSILSCLDQEEELGPGWIIFKTAM